jgi:hypothetical protein
VASETLLLPFRTRETVATPTPAAAATSAIRAGVPEIASILTELSQEQTSSVKARLLTFGEKRT